MMGANLHKRILAKQTWIAAFFALATLMTVSHYHDIEDTILAHECTICSVASHLDDVDTSQTIDVYDHQVTEPFLQSTITVIYKADLISSAARGPPLS
jgi:hypothetical protein